MLKNNHANGPVQKRKRNDLVAVRIPRALIERTEVERHKIAISSALKFAAALKYRDAFISVLLKTCVDCDGCLKRAQTEICMQGGQIIRLF